MTWFFFVTLLEIVLTLSCLFLLIKDGSKPERIWTWIFVIVFIPFIGAILYLAFGVNLRRQKIFDLKKEIDYVQFERFVKRYSAEAEKNILKRHDVTATYLHLIRLLTRVNSAILTFNNKVKILNDGPETFDAIFEACEKAEKYIHLQYYIFIDGDLADRFAELFKKKIKQGVEVRLIYDALGSWDLSNRMIDKFREIGVLIFPFMPVRFGRLARLNYRNHRKILIVDGIIGFTGGINVDDKYIKDDDFLGHWTDTHLKIHGMSVNFLHFVFLADWLFVTRENLIKPEMFKLMDEVGDTPVQIVSSGPDADYPNILQQYLYILYQAKEYVYIVNPYLIPDSTLSLALKTVALSGIDVRIIVPRNSESAMIHWTVQSFFSRFLNAGVKIYLFEEGFIHSKVILSDDSVCSIGTANLDIRSFEQNFEVNALIYNKEVTMTMKKQFALFQNSSKQLTPEEHAARPNIDRVKEKLARLATPLM
ncbi:cardiolipin synthase [Eudoraea adriatica]|uniref:cardiolipin synthase n=1 Tax=Eudoraea adriatica TaxID=446681 RepID=UPI00037BD05A|nr:cardiolipin synthase [Eudoraea adriatica]